MPRRKEDDVAEALNMNPLRDANMQSIAGKSELEQLIDTYFPIMKLMMRIPSPIQVCKFGLFFIHCKIPPPPTTTTTVIE